MSDGKINERILELVKKLTGDDKKLADFLKELLLEEIENPGQWQWNKTYRKLVEKYAEQWSNEYED